MLILTGLTNLACFPALYVAYHKRLYFQFYFGLFTFLTSLMYHSLESLELKELYLKVSEWHKLDNIGSIQCFIMLMVYFMDNLDKRGDLYFSKHSSNTDTQLNLIGLFITMIMQANHPWKLENTTTPILIFVGVLCLKLVFVRKSRLNKYYFGRGVSIMTFAVYFFIRGLDDKNDFLRLNHGLWHCCCGLSSFYLWQSIDKDKGDLSIKNIKLSPQPRFELVTVLKKLLKLEFFQSQEVKFTLL